MLRFTLLCLLCAFVVNQAYTNAEKPPSETFSLVPFDAHELPTGSVCVLKNLKDLAGILVSSASHLSNVLKGIGTNKLQAKIETIFCTVMQEIYSTKKHSKNDLEKYFGEDIEKIEEAKSKIVSNVCEFDQNIFEIVMAKHESSVSGIGKAETKRKIKRLLRLKQVNDFFQRQVAHVEKMQGLSTNLQKLLTASSELKTPDGSVPSKLTPRIKYMKTLADALEGVENRLQNNQREWSIYYTKSSFDIISLQQSVSSLFRLLFQEMEDGPMHKWGRYVNTLRSIQGEIIQEAISTLEAFEKDFDHPMNMLINGEDTILCKIPARWTYWTEFSLLVLENSLHVKESSKPLCNFILGDASRNMRRRVFDEALQMCKKTKAYKSIIATERSLLCNEWFNPKHRRSKNRFCKRSKAYWYSKSKFDSCNKGKARGRNATAVHLCMKKKYSRKLNTFLELSHLRGQGFSHHSDEVKGTTEEECPTMFVGDSNANFGAVDLNDFDAIGKFQNGKVALSVGTGESPFVSNAINIGTKFTSTNPGHVALFTPSQSWLKNCADSTFTINAAIDEGAVGKPKRIETYSVHVKVHPEGKLERRVVSYEIEEIMNSDETTATAAPPDRKSVV